MNFCSYRKIQNGSSGSEDHDLIKSHTLHPVSPRLHESPRTIILLMGLGGGGGEEGGEVGAAIFREHSHETVFSPLGCACFILVGNKIS